MTIVILEDEAPARAWFEQVLARHRPGAELVALASVAEAIAYLAAHPPPDLIIADIQLADGLSLEIFDHTQPGCPVIFATAYDEYVIEALQRDGIAYLLKPLREPDVVGALAKYDRLESHFAERVRGLARRLGAPRRLVARRRDGFVVLSLAEVADFAVDDKLVDVITRDSSRSTRSSPSWRPSSAPSFPGQPPVPGVRRRGRRVPAARQGQAAGRARAAAVRRGHRQPGQRRAVPRLALRLTHGGPPGHAAAASRAGGGRRSSSQNTSAWLTSSAGTTRIGRT
jgi:two-component system, LytTR family, response regulator